MEPIKYLDEHGLDTMAGVLNFGRKKIWHGTKEQWDALADTEKQKYDQAEVLDEAEVLPGGGGEAYDDAELRGLIADEAALREQKDQEIVDAANENFTALNEKDSSHDNKIAELEAKIAELEAKIAELEAKLSPTKITNITSYLKNYILTGLQEAYLVVTGKHVSILLSLLPKTTATMRLYTLKPSSYMLPDSPLPSPSRAYATAAQSAIYMAGSSEKADTSCALLVYNDDFTPDGDELKLVVRGNLNDTTATWYRADYYAA